MGVISTQAFTFRLVANGQQLDLFEDEDIKLSNNITGLFDIGQLPSDFTRTITLPGTKTNNAFFEHIYDISIDSPFLFATAIGTGENSSAFRNFSERLISFLEKQKHLILQLIQF